MGPLEIAAWAIAQRCIFRTRQAAIERKAFDEKDDA
jgi:hypothetical protein